MDLKQLAAATGWTYRDPFGYYRQLGETWAKEQNIVGFQNPQTGTTIDITGDPEGEWSATFWTWDGYHGEWILNARATHLDGKLDNYLMIWMGGAEE